jgi:hypothetical protein
MSRRWTDLSRAGTLREPGGRQGYQSDRSGPQGPFWSRLEAYLAGETDTLEAPDESKLRIRRKQGGAELA